MWTHKADSLGLVVVDLFSGARKRQNMSASYCTQCRCGSCEKEELGEGKGSRRSRRRKGERRAGDDCREQEDYKSASLLRDQISAVSGLQVRAGRWRSVNKRRGADRRQEQALAGLEGSRGPRLAGGSVWEEGRGAFPHESAGWRGWDSVCPRRSTSTSCSPTATHGHAAQLQPVLVVVAHFLPGRVLFSGHDHPLAHRVRRRRRELV
eukprot:766752-Hanusia_phi.AAC.2